MRRWLLCLTIANLPRIVLAQNEKQTFQLAQEALVRNDYAQAKNHFERLIFFTPAYRVSACYRGLAEADAGLGNLSDAAHHYDLAYTNATTEKEKTDLLFMKANLLIGQHAWFDVITEILSLPDAPDSVFQRKNLLLATAEFGIGKFSESESAFLLSINQPNETDTIMMDNFFRLVRKANRLHPKLAKWMSIVLPGSGQLYAGDFRNGMNSLILTSGLGFLMYNTALIYGIGNSALSIFPWLFRYYVGGFQRAEKTAEKNNAIRRGKIFDGIIRYLQQRNSL